MGAENQAALEVLCPYKELCSSGGEGWPFKLCIKVTLGWQPCWTGLLPASVEKPTMSPPVFAFIRDCPCPHSALRIVLTNKLSSEIVCLGIFSHQYLPVP